MKGSTPAIAVLVGGRITFRTHEYDHDPSAPSFGSEAAEALGVHPARVFKTPVTSSERRTPGTRARAGRR